jgi:hypothetical protein
MHNRNYARLAQMEQALGTKGFARTVVEALERG